jgi:hypothetical protein
MIACAQRLAVQGIVLRHVAHEVLDRCGQRIASLTKSSSARDGP